MNKNVTLSNQKASLSDASQLQSNTIDLLRFPLTIMVIFIHMNPNVINLLEADFELLSGRGIYNVIGIVFSHVLTHIAVPIFFLISGFLFFYNIPKLSWDAYKRKVKSRTKTLFIPYILWNLVPFVLAVLGKLALALVSADNINDVLSMIQEKSWHIFYDCREWGTTQTNWLGDNLRMTGPYDLPLWFLRDLIVVTVLAPLIYYAIKKLRLSFVLFLFAAYISRVWTLLSGFHITAFFYFSTGAYFALNRLNIVTFANKYKYLLIPVCACLLVVTTIYDGTNTVIGQNVYPLFVFSGVFTAFYLASWCISNYDVRPNKFLVSCCFFIYAFHGVGLPLIGTPLVLITRVLHKIIPGNTGIENGIVYLFAPFLTAFMCIVVLMVARKMFPKITLLFSGNR